jgi:hypothetical protein
MTFREETQAFTHLNDQLAQLERPCGVVHRDTSHNPLEVFNERVLEDYFEVHLPIRARSSLPECPRPGVASPRLMASSNAAKSCGSSSSHPFAASGPPSFPTNVDHDLSASRRSSSGVNFSSSDSISAKLIAVLIYARRPRKASRVRQQPLALLFSVFPFPLSAFQPIHFCLLLSRFPLSTLVFRVPYFCFPNFCFPNFCFPDFSFSEF